MKKTEFGTLEVMSGIGPSWQRGTAGYCDFYYILLFNDLYDPHKTSRVNVCSEKGLWETDLDEREGIDEQILAGIEYLAKEEQVRILCECCRRPFRHVQYGIFLAIKICYQGEIGSCKRLSASLGSKLAKWINICYEKGFLSGNAAQNYKI